MTDIVERLDEARRLLDGDVDEGWLLEAADEIVSLRARLAEAARCSMADCPGEAAVCRRHHDELAASRERVQRRLAEVDKTLRPLVDDDNRPVEALARYAVARLAEAEELLEALRADLDEAGKDTRRLDSGKMRFQLVTGGAWLTWTGDLRAAIDAAVREPAP